MAELFAIGFQEGTGTTAADSSGNSRTFTAVGTAPWNASGKNNACIAPTAGNYFQRTAGIGTGTITTFTAMVWYYRTGTPSTWGQFMYDGSGNGFWFEIASDGRVDLNGDVYSPSAVPLNTWTHIAVTCSAGALTMYINGTSAATGTWAGGSSVLLNSPWNIGLGPDGPATGRVDEARFYNTALSGAEVVTAMNAPIPGNTGTAASTLPALTQAAAGTYSAGTRTGAAASTLPALTQAAAGTFTAPSATAQSVLPALTQAATGTFTPPPITGSAASTLPALTQSAAGTVSNPPTDARFVTGIHSSGRYFIDQYGDPILVKGDSPWSAFVDLSTSEWDTWCANRASHGFNAALVSLLGNPENGGPNANGATFDGIQPFTGTYTPNAAYWSRIDTFVQTAADHGITLFLYASDGWVVKSSLSGVISGMNATQAQTYGAFVANRYASAPNIVWMSGGDFFPGVGTDETISQNVLTGIRSVDSVRIHSMQAMYQRSASRQWSTWNGKVQWDFLYTRLPTYELVRKSFARTPAMPALFAEGIYDGMYSGTTAQSELVSRMQIGWALTSGSPGDIYGTEDWQFFSGWAGRLDRNSAVQADRIRSAVESVDWWKLEPAPSFITSGAGTPYVFPNEPSAGSDPGFGNLDDASAPSGAAGTLHSHTYATAAASADGSLAVVYLPTQRAITINTSALGASPTGSWFNPTTGSSSTANLASLTPPSSGDWLLILEATPIAVTGSAASTLPALTQSATGTATPPARTGTAVSSLPALAQSAVGGFTPPVYAGGAASVLPGLTQVAEGTFEVPAYTGGAGSTLPGLTQNAQGTFTPPVYTGSGATVLPALNQAATGTVTNPPGNTGMAASILPSLTQVAAGVVTIPARTGSAASTLPALVQSATGTSGQGTIPDVHQPLGLTFNVPERGLTLIVPNRTIHWSDE